MNGDRRVRLFCPKGFDIIRSFCTGAAGAAGATVSTTGVAT